MVFASIIESGFIMKSPHAIKDRLDKKSGSSRAPPPRVGPTKKETNKTLTTKVVPHKMVRRGAKLLQTALTRGSLQNFLSYGRIYLLMAKVSFL